MKARAGRILRFFASVKLHLHHPIQTNPSWRFITLFVLLFWGLGFGGGAECSVLHKIDSHRASECAVVQRVDDVATIVG